MRIYLFASLLIFLPSCGLQTQNKMPVGISGNEVLVYKNIGEIPAPEGSSRIIVKDGSFADWLRNIKLKKDKRVFLYNGLLKNDQTEQFAVLDEKVGHKDLQQCADAIIRLRAEYFFSKHEYDSLHFTATDGTVLSFTNWRQGTRYRLNGSRLKSYFINNNTTDINTDFENYLETVFSYCGTVSLSSELLSIQTDALQPGDIFIKPGFPGHAMIVVDVCINKDNRKFFMLAQGFMPAQDIHIVKNPINPEMSPWYELPEEGTIVTPAWEFSTTQLKRWK